VNIPIDWAAAGPAVYVATGAVVALMIDAFWPRRSWLASGLPLLAGLVAGLVELGRTGSVDEVSAALTFVILAGTVLVLVGAAVMSDEDAMPPGELHLLLGSAASGALAMASARDLVTLVVSIELLALPSIALVGLRHGDRRGIVSAWTFFLASVVSTAVTLMGVALLYGSTGTLTYAGLSRELVDPAVPDAVVAVAVVLTLVGLLFKLGAVPFHAWVPDTYRGASVMVAGFLASVSKAGALGALLVLLALGLGPRDHVWVPVIAVVATASMTLGNLAALRERDGVGMLAWSSVAQAGFLVAPLTAVSTAEGLSAPLQYLTVYALANIVGFTALAVVLRRRGSTSYDSLTGLARTEPWLGVPLAFVALTLAGFPPAVIGLITKYVVLRPVVDDGMTWLAVVMAVNVMLGLAYYLRLVVVLVSRPAEEHGITSRPAAPTRLATLAVTAGTAALVVLSVLPGLLLDHLP
jgi:NADH-quinone oxidoreductase subunit N